LHHQHPFQPPSLARTSSQISPKSNGLLRGLPLYQLSVDVVAGEFGRVPWLRRRGGTARWVVVVDTVAVGRVGRVGKVEVNGTGFANRAVGGGAGVGLA